MLFHLVVYVHANQEVYNMQKKYQNVLRRRSMFHALV